MSSVSTSLPSYSVAIRTLGLSGKFFEKELNSILKQSVQPEKIIIYIAEGYQRPTFTTGKEIYIEVPKGMVSQRAIDYTEINSEYILLLDDDVELAYDSVEKLLKSAIDYKADCISAETVHNHSSSLMKKIYDIFVNMTFPLYGTKWGMIISNNGAMSYNGNPESRFYISQTGEGAAILVRKSTWLNCNIKDEKWMDDLGFAYGDDLLEIYKLHSNGYRCGILYGSNIKHLDAATSSEKYKNSIQRFRNRSQAIFINWHRMFLCRKKLTLLNKIVTIFAFSLRFLIIQFSYFIAALRFRNFKIIAYHFLGLSDGIKYIKTNSYRTLPPFA